MFKTAILAGIRNSDPNESKMKWRGLGLTVAMLAVGSCASAANAVTIEVNYTASGGDGTPITIGDAASPQYFFVLGTFFNGDAQYKIQANAGATVAFPDNGVPQLNLPAVTTRLEGVTFTDGDYQLAFDIGPIGYTGFATVENEGRLISAITYNPVAAVPEPATWAMLALAFAGLGLVGYRTKTRNPATA
jgi:hypothetical protein